MQIVILLQYANSSIYFYACKKLVNLVFSKLIDTFLNKRLLLLSQKTDYYAILKVYATFKSKTTRFAHP